MEKQYEDKIEQIEKMRMGAEYSFPVKCRGLRMFLRPLTINEHNHVMSETTRILSKSGMATNAPTEHSTYVSILLEMASTSAPGKTDPQITDVIVGRMTPDEIQFVYDQWLEGCKRCDPSLETMKPEELNAIVESIKKKEKTLTELSSWETREVCRHLLTS